MSNIWRAQDDQGCTLEDFLSRDFDPAQLAEDHFLPLTVIDLSDTKICGVSKPIYRVQYDADGRVESVPITH